MAKRTKPIKEVANLGKPFWIRAATRVVDMVFNRTVSKGQDVDGTAFKDYDSRYAKRKSSGKIKGQAGGAGRSSIPNLYLTSKTMNSLLVYPDTATDYNIKVGWISGKSAQKVEWNEDMGRAIKKDTGFAFGSAIERWWFRNINRALDKKLKKVSDKTVFKIG